MERFLIIRTSSLGDIVHTLPAFAALRRHRPAARIAWVVEPKGRAILEFVPGLDDIITVGSTGWKKKIRGKNQTALDFQGLIKSGLIAWQSRAKTRLGFSRPNLKEAAVALFYTQRLRPVPETDHVILKNLRLLGGAGIQDETFDFPLAIPQGLKDTVREKLSAAIRASGRRLVVFNVGAAWPTKRWPAGNWSSALRALANEDISPLLLWGTPEEKEIADVIHRETGAAVAPFLAIGELLALLANAALLVSGDTFALQAACALDIPVVGIFGPTDPRRNGPFRPRDKIAYHEVECSRCYRRACGPMTCLKLVTPEEVVALIRQALRNHG